jgi:hypothetical protein
MLKNFKTKFAQDKAEFIANWVKRKEGGKEVEYMLLTLKIGDKQVTLRHDELMALMFLTAKDEDQDRIGRMGSSFIDQTHLQVPIRFTARYDYRKGDLVDVVVIVPVDRLQLDFLKEQAKKKYKR